MLWVTIVPSGEGDFEDGGHYYCLEYPTPDDPCNCKRWYVQIMIDTAYGYQDDQGRDCRQLHMDIITEIYNRGFKWSEWQDEFTGEWHTALPVKEKV